MAKVFSSFYLCNKLLYFDLITVFGYPSRPSSRPRLPLYEVSFLKKSTGKALTVKGIISGLHAVLLRQSWTTLQKRKNRDLSFCLFKFHRIIGPFFIFTADGKTNNRFSDMQIADVKTNKLIITVQHQKDPCRF